MKLHEAIESVLRYEKRPLSAEEISDRINKEKLYIRIDRKQIERQQVILRSRKYSQIFAVQGNMISLIDNRIGSLEYLAKSLKQLLNNDGSDSRSSKILLPVWLYFFRNSNYFKVTDNFEENNFEKFLNYFLNYFESIGFDYSESKEISLLLRALRLNTLRDMISMTKVLNNDSIIDTYFNKFNKNLIQQELRGEYFFPSDLARIMTHFIDKSKTQVSINDPFASSTNLYVDIAKYKNGKDSIFYIDVNNNDLAILLKFNFIVNGIPDFHVQIKDSFKSYDSKRYDYIISCPPFGGKIEQQRRNEIDNLHELFPIGFSSRIDVMSIQIVLSRMSNIGKAIIVVPEGFLFSNDKASLRLRKYLIDQNYLNTVVSLPSGLFHPYSDVKTSLIILDKNQKANTFITFYKLDLEDINAFDPNVNHVFPGEMSQVNKGLFISNNYNLEYPKYNDFHLKTSNENIMPLHQLVRIKNIGVAVKPDLLNSKEGIPYIKIKDLKGEEGFPKLDISLINSFVSDIDELQNSKALTSKNELHAGTILVAKNGLSIKATIVADQTEALVSNNIIAMDVDRSFVSPEYLLSQFHEEYIIKQLDAVRKGEVIPFLRLDDLLNVKVIVPPFEKQREIEKSFFIKKIHTVESAKKEQGNFDKIENDKIIGAIKHEFGNLQRPVASNLQLIKEFFKEKVISATPLQYSDRISKRPSSMPVIEVFDVMQKQLNEMASLLGDMQEILSFEKETIRKSKVEVHPFFDAIKKEYQESYFDFDFDKVKFISIDENQFKKAIRNFIDNSIKHGFENKPIDKGIILKVKLGENEDIIIDLINKGKPFDNDFNFDDYINFGAKSGDWQGKGIGGYLINRIIKNHDGKFELINNSNVHFRITIPK